MLDSDVFRPWQRSASTDHGVAGRAPAWPWRAAPGQQGLHGRRRRSCGGEQHPLELRGDVCRATQRSLVVHLARRRLHMPWCWRPAGPAEPPATVAIVLRACAPELRSVVAARRRRGRRQQARALLGAAGRLADGRRRVQSANLKFTGLTQNLGQL
jgi:hypothetical protein